jgi:RHS repeat-associated protein
VAEYDLAGETLARVDPTGARTQATYDDLGRQITATRIERKPASAAYTTTMEYDDAGRLVKQTAPGPGTKITSYEVNAAGEVTTVTDPLTNETSTDYDLAGRVVKVTDPNGNATVAEYDLAGRQITAKDLNSSGVVQRISSYGYDPADNPTSATSPEGHVTRQTFDALNRLTSLIEPVSAGESITTSFGYDATGARTRLTDGRGNATWTSYNSLGLPETVTEPATTAHPNPADRTWTHLYDAAGNQVATLQPGGVRIDRTFDHLGRLTTETGAGGGAASAERTFGYDLADRLTTAGDLTIGYNDRGLPLQISRGATQESAYSYDALGNPTQRIDAAGTLTYGYDPASRLKTITATSGQAGTQSFDYDALDRLTAQTLKNGSGTELAKITYGWDKDDNLTTKTTSGLAGAGTNTYTYDHANRLTSWTTPGGITTAYEWDAAGNRTKAGDKTYTYDERNRLTSGDDATYIYTPRGTLATQTKNGTTTQLTFDAFDRLIADGDSLYAYDAFDRVTSRISGATKQTHHYAGLGNDLAAISAGGSVQATYARDPFGALLGLREGTEPGTATLSDLHGDLVATHSGAAITSSTAYDPFGAVTAQTGAKTSLGYQGEYTDPDTGKVNMHARWYQPGTGTFTSRDTATLAPSPSVQANRYTYANASPLTGTDPTGHYTVVGSGAIAGPGNLYTPDTDNQTAAGVYAEYGILAGSGGSSNSGGTCIGSCYGGGGAVDDTCASLGFCLGSGAIEVVDPAALAGDIDPYEKLRLIPGLGRVIYCLQSSSCGGATGSSIGAKYGPGGNTRRLNASPRNFWEYCADAFGKKNCDAWRQATQQIEMAKEFSKKCISEKGARDRGCMLLAHKLGISDQAWGEMIKEAFKGTDLFEVLDLFTHNAMACQEGDPLGCLDLATDLFYGAGRKLSKAALEALGKVVTKLGAATTKAAKTCGTGSVCGWEKISRIVRGASTRRGNFGLGSATREQADAAGKAWVGPGFRKITTKKGQVIYISRDGLRQYRTPSYKPKLGKYQANLEWRDNARGEWSGGNGHLSITE